MNHIRTSFADISGKALLSFVLLFGANAVYADDAAVAVLDANKVLISSKVYKDIAKQVEDKQEALAKSAREKQEGLMKSQKEIEGAKSAMSDSAVKEKTDALNRDFANFQQILMQQHEAMKGASDASMHYMYQEISGISSEYAKKHKYSVVVDKSVTHYVDAKVDISDPVLRALDQKIKSYKVDFSALDSVEAAAKVSTAAASGSASGSAKAASSASSASSAKSASASAAKTGSASAKGGASANSSSTAAKAASENSGSAKKKAS